MNTRGENAHWNMVTFVQQLPSIMFLTDGYKVDHRRQYPSGTEFVYSNFTPRNGYDSTDTGVIFFGLQYLLKHYFVDYANVTFFDRPRDEVLAEYQAFLDGYLGPNQIGVEHIGALHDLGYIPLEFWALPEGTFVPYGVPVLTVENTHREFFWVTNYFETLISSVLWMACTSATTAWKYRKIFEHFDELTGADPAGRQWRGHDFSERGMPGPEAAILSGAAHLTQFTGTDTVPAIPFLQNYYGATGLIGGSVPATEHSVMCAGGPAGEKETFSRVIGLYETGIVALVSDTYDFYHVQRVILRELKDQIMSRDGKTVIRPDSGDPVKMLVGDPDATDEIQRKGLIENLWDIFGGTVNEKGFKVLDSHIGAIYGDSITLERARAILQGLHDKGFASSNVVFGIGSFTYQYVTRDTHGFAMKATHAVVNGEERQLFKDPITGKSKKSHKGRMIVVRENNVLRAIDGLDLQTQYENVHDDVLEPVFSNGALLKNETLDNIRALATAA